jgi:hypothetical protein
MEREGGRAGGREGGSAERGGSLRMAGVTAYEGAAAAAATATVAAAAGTEGAEPR